MKDKFYIVKEILNRDGTEKHDGRTEKTVGRHVCISSRDGLVIGLPCYLWYFTDWEGNEVHHFCHKTSEVLKIEINNDITTVTTEQSVYKLREVEE